MERVELGRAPGRVLARPLLADRDQPPFARSTRDGFACRAHEASAHVPLAIAGATRAGEAPAGKLPPGSAWEIMTGAPVPPGADAVVMLEHVETANGQVKLAPKRTIAVGENIVAQGAQARKGDELLPAGTAIASAQVALAAACGHAALEVFIRPRVAILTTGDEIVPVKSMPAPGQIRNSNGPMLAAMVVAAGGEPWILPTASDNARALDTALAQAAEADLLLITGGVSAGKFDLVEPALARAGARFHFTGVRIQPGKPLVFGEMPRHRNTAGNAAAGMQEATKQGRAHPSRRARCRSSGCPVIRSLRRLHSCCLRLRCWLRLPEVLNPVRALRWRGWPGRSRISSQRPASRVFCLQNARLAPPASCRRWRLFPGKAPATWPQWPTPTAFLWLPEDSHRSGAGSTRCESCFTEENDIEKQRAQILAPVALSTKPARPAWWT